MVSNWSSWPRRPRRSCRSLRCTRRRRWNFLCGVHSLRGWDPIKRDLEVGLLVIGLADGSAKTFTHQEAQATFVIHSRQPAGHINHLHRKLAPLHIPQSTCLPGRVPPYLVGPIATMAGGAYELHADVGIGEERLEFVSVNFGTKPRRWCGCAAACEAIHSSNGCKGKRDGVGKPT